MLPRIRVRRYTMFMSTVFCYFALMITLVIGGEPMTFGKSFRRSNHRTTGTSKEPDHLRGSYAAYILHTVGISNDESVRMNKMVNKEALS